MSEFKDYKIDLDQFDKEFKFTESGLTHKQGSRFKLLPYAANEKTLVYDFSGVLGSFSRCISDKEIKGEFNCEEFIEEVAEQVGEYEGNLSEETFKDIIRTIFIKEENLVNFDIKTLNYISSTNADEKIARFLYSVLVDENIKKEALNHYDIEVDNILYKLVLKALPILKEKQYQMDEYKCYIPYIKEIFIKDFRFLIKNEELYKNSLKRLLEYYYMFYVSQLSIKLDQFENAELDKVEKIYYTLSWESTSKNRTAYRLGWNLLKNKVNSLFSHAITLELLNTNNCKEQLGYTELSEIYSNLDKSELEENLKKVVDAYQNQVKDVSWDEFKITSKQSSVNGFNEVYRLYDSLEYQFERKDSRNRAYKAYRNWFIKFVEKNFAKRRGALGYNLNLTEDDIILMTKICINDKKKLKLNVLFEEFEKRGLFFDMDSSKKIIQLYEKLNLLEKKSDSGDAQYVRSVL
ncbi:TPA: DNA phosphorothioation-dependent restriction protein DptG [Clostridium perfringens]|uniref:DNA phosphorothioation-dependent restriction protein DptG n=1 Tax=Clostridium perfringens TaxID=1502 RepID=UPI0013E38CCB|nr:DNA phosphorothioation-dependent restriction protein DptG [Clostridium perfringens]MDM0523800.1 DNA phosphorothioation-dependent restriction protein DptG [Clostridium perfringens]NGU20954.1 DNA phosphorothioation-dependent restriction protein DptG [Clostridium perfringens]